jgi:hypothetical protein
MTVVPALAASSARPNIPASHRGTRIIASTLAATMGLMSVQPGTGGLQVMTSETLGPLCALVVCDWSFCLDSEELVPVL